MRDFYEVLGVARDAGAVELKKAYHNLAVKYHPDRNPDDAGAEEKFKEAANAYSVLSNPEQRARYDRFGAEGLRGGGSNGFSGVEDIFSAFGDIFGDLFGGQGRRRQARGADLRIDLSLSFAEAVWGTTKEVRVSRDVKCQVCKGSGAKEGTRPETCSTCEGKGQVLHSQGFFMIQTTCPRCRGEGAVVKDVCAGCQGRRTQVESSILSVTVPAGVDDGQTLRLAGKGEAPPSGGGQAGHLYVVLHVEADERFQREEESITTEVMISYVKAALGGEVEVPTLDEECTGKATIEVKPGTQPGDTVIRRGEGIPHINQRNRGDHIVQFAIEIPKKLGAREAELLREIAAERNEDVKGPKRSLFGRAKK